MPALASASNRAAIDANVERDRVGRRAQTLTHDQRGQVALGFGKRPQKRSLQVGVDLLASSISARLGLNATVSGMRVVKQMGTYPHPAVAYA